MDTGAFFQAQELEAEKALLMTSNQDITLRLKRTEVKAKDFKERLALEAGAHAARWAHALSLSPQCLWLPHINLLAPGSC
jgi:hypothetical protein